MTEMSLEYQINNNINVLKCTFVFMVVNRYNKNKAMLFLTRQVERLDVTDIL